MCVVYSVPLYSSTLPPENRHRSGHPSESKFSHKKIKRVFSGRNVKRKGEYNENIKDLF
jgi:hypothetical protein